MQSLKPRAKLFFQKACPEHPGQLFPPLNIPALTVPHLLCSRGGEGYGACSLSSKYGSKWYNQSPSKGLTATLVEVREGQRGLMEPWGNDTGFEGQVC